jgi:hypothetical protein
MLEENIPSNSLGGHTLVYPTANHCRISGIISLSLLIWFQVCDIPPLPEHFKGDGTNYNQEIVPINDFSKYFSSLSSPLQNEALKTPCRRQLRGVGRVQSCIHIWSDRGKQLLELVRKSPVIVILLGSWR